MPERTRTTEELEAYYGLPEKVVFWQRCVMSNQRPSSYPEFKHTRHRITPTLHIDEESICDACRYADRKEEIGLGYARKRLRAPIPASPTRALIISHTAAGRGITE